MSGLLCAKANIDSEILLDGNDMFKEFKGSIAEQYVLCELKGSTKLELFYYSPEIGISEIDYITQIGKYNIPIEVKAETNSQAKSLKTFINKYDSKINIRVSGAEYKEEETICNIPLYLVSKLENIVKNINLKKK